MGGGVRHFARRRTLFFPEDGRSLPFIPPARARAAEALAAAHALAPPGACQSAASVAPRHSMQERCRAAPSARAGRAVSIRATWRSERAGCRWQAAAGELRHCRPPTGAWQCRRPSAHLSCGFRAARWVDSSDLARRRHDGDLCRRPNNDVTSLLNWPYGGSLAQCLGASKKDTHAQRQSLP